MRDVVLINPRDHTHVRRLLGLRAPPLNLMYLAAFLRNDGFSVLIIDDNLVERGPLDVAQTVSKEGVKIAGITAATSTLSSAFSYINAIKRLDPEIVTVLGGPHISFLPIETLGACPSLDVAVLGEGEETLLELAHRTSLEAGLAGVRGIVYRDRESVKINPPRQLIHDLDKLPFPARDLVDFNRYQDPVGGKPIGSMITSRGCVFGCLFCASSRMMGSKFRFRSPSSVAEEMSELVEKYRVEDIQFIDDNFLLSRKRAVAIASEIRRRGLDVDFAASSRVDTVEDSLIRELRSAGLSTLYLGFESGSERVLDLMNKGVTVQQGVDAAGLAKRHSLKTFGSFIFGYPGETLGEMDQTINYSTKLNLDFAQFSILTPYPGAPIYEKLLREDLLAERNYDRFTAVDPIVAYERLGMSSRAVVRKLDMAYLRFYCRPRYLLEHPYMIKMIPRAFIRSVLHGHGDDRKEMLSA